jgi:hypothetical protein
MAMILLGYGEQSGHDRIARIFLLPGSSSREKRAGSQGEDGKSLPDPRLLIPSPSNLRSKAKLLKINSNLRLTVQNPARFKQANFIANEAARRRSDAMDLRQIALGRETANHESNRIAPPKQWLFM